MNKERDGFHNLMYDIFNDENRVRRAGYLRIGMARFGSHFCVICSCGRPLTFTSRPKHFYPTGPHYDMVSDSYRVRLVGEFGGRDLCGNGREASWWWLAGWNFLLDTLHDTGVWCDNNWWHGGCRVHDKGVWNMYCARLKGVRRSSRQRSGTKAQPYVD